MGTPTKGEIVLYRFPFSDLSSRKLRPCLVLSEEIKKDVILCQISSKQKTASDIPLTNNILHHESFIRCNKLFTAKAERLRKISKVTDHVYERVIKNIVGIIQ